MTTPIDRTVRLALEELIKTDAVAFYEFVMMCRDKNHQPWGNTRQVIEDIGLTQMGKIHDETRRVTLANTTGADLEVRLI